MVMELFPKKHYKETVTENYSVTANGRIYVGDVPEKEDDKEEEYENAEVQLKQYALADGTFMINELVLIESDQNGLGGYRKVLDYDILNERCGAELLPAVLIADGGCYAYIYSGSRQAKVVLYRFETYGLRITRLAFDNRYISLDDLREVIDRVFRSEGSETLLLRSSSLLSEKV